MSEQGNVDQEDLQSTLLEFHQNPINLRTCDAQQLRQLPFLSEQQVDEILAYRAEHGFDRVEELMLVRDLDEYTIRDLRPFVYIGSPPRKKFYFSDIFRFAKHELTTRLDARNVENYTGDPVFFQTRYRFNYANRVKFGFTLRRAAGAAARDMLYGGYIELRDWGPMRRVVAGNFEAGFGCGLVSANAYHMGKTNFVMNAGYREQGLHALSSVVSRVGSLHGIGATVGLIGEKGSRFKNHHLDFSAWYSLTRSNDSIRRHLIGTNLTYRYGRLHIGATAVVKLYSDSVYPARNYYYNRTYFRGRSQAVLGANIRYNFGRVDLFAEGAMAQSAATVISPRWGGAVNAGLRIYPTSDISLMALYRYYSQTFDNDIGYGFSESSRMGDENGGYLAIDITRWRGLRLSGYVDAFYFSGPKYGIREDGTWGMDGVAQAEYQHQQFHRHLLRFRGRIRAGRNRLDGRYQYRWTRAGWTLRTQAEVAGRSTSTANIGGLVFQDIEYTFRSVPLMLQARLIGFHVTDWDNRIYLYEQDVLYAGMIPFVYGVGGRGYLNLRAQLLKSREETRGSRTIRIPGLTLYFRASCTLYTNDWAVSQKRKMNSDTDIHSTLRLTF